ncbi:hypothetical protein CF319_g4763 [Tilletia indica]|uniref:Uncharacterized protein n=1 Tax=Tilletia indica TaxID=43049 RepID=A0A177TCD1_9BASI|nr:hypothetical protein CF319_g4763 [Tilletia indica]KAE8228073.1 hypothetical protein CF326_g7008 [Tilletia indica]KAE8250963.1 hypothetical protein A4X13_0g4227 [Tilletia indica]
MATPTTPGSSSKTMKWATHLALTGDVILGTADSKDAVHDINSTMDDEDGEMHQLSLNCWSREVPLQGLYLLYKVPFATNPNRLGVSYPAQMRRVPDEFEGMLSAAAALPASPVMLSGCAPVVWIDATRKTAIVQGFTYLNKTHQWQQFKIRIMFEDNSRWAAWLIPGARTLVDFDCVIVRMGADDIYDAYIRRIMTLGPAPPALLQALEITSPGNDDRAERLRQARAANRLSAQQKGKGTEEAATNHSKQPVEDGTTLATVTPPTPSTPPPTQTRKRNRME